MRTRALALGPMLAIPLALGSVVHASAQTVSSPPAQSELWRGTVEEMRDRLRESLRDVEARIRRLSEEMREDASRGGDVDRMIETQRRIQMMQLRQREVQSLQEMLSVLNNIARTLETFGESQQQRPQEQRRTVRDRLGWHVVSIITADGGLRAELWSEQGARVSVRRGTRLVDGSEVVEVTPEGVGLRRADGETVRLERADMAYVAMRIGQLSEEHQAGLRALGLGGPPPGMGVPGPMPGGVPSGAMPGGMPSGAMPGMAPGAGMSPGPGFGVPPGAGPGGPPPQQ